MREGKAAVTAAHAGAIAIRGPGVYVTCRARIEKGYRGIFGNKPFGGVGISGGSQVRNYWHHKRGVTLRAILLLAGALAAAGCGGGSSGGGGGGTPPPPAVPAISNINGATAPSSAAGQPIEIIGSNFQAGSSTVIFTQGNLTATVTPSTGGTDTSLVATVPSGNSSSQFTLPGDITVTVQNSGGTSNGKTLAVTPAPNFSINTVAWTTTNPLPFPPLTGLRAVAVPVSDSLAYIVVTGGFNGATNTPIVYSNTLNPGGTVGPNWTAIPDIPLPTSLAHHGMVEADSTNSPAPAGSNFIYVIGGQQSASNSPGGSSTIFMAQVNSTTGAVGSWTQLPNSLPETLVGPTVALHNGWVYVIGGLRSDGTPSPNVYTAQVNSDGSLGVWTTAQNSFPHGISFATAFGYGGNLFVLDGDTANSLNPNLQGNELGDDSVFYARISKGIVGPWTPNPTNTLASRKKHVTWSAFGQLLNAEGIYGGGVGSLELEWSAVNSANTLNVWNAVINQIHANVYNAAAVVSPLLSPAGTPRFLLLGGQNFVPSGVGQLTNQVYYNIVP